MKHVDRDIERYFDGAIQTAEAHEALFGHLDRCPECRTYFDDLALGHRMLAQDRTSMPRTELDLLLPIVLGRSDAKVESRIPSWVWSALGPALAAVFVLLFIGPPELTPKGSHGVHRPRIEVLCFDEQFELTKHLQSDGACAAPGWIKVVYASAESVPTLTVAAIADDGRIRFVARLEKPDPRSVVPDHAKLASGERVRIVVSTQPLDDKALMAAAPAMTIVGVEP